MHSTFSISFSFFLCTKTQNDRILAFLDQHNSSLRNAESELEGQTRREQLTWKPMLTKAQPRLLEYTLVTTLVTAKMFGRRPSVVCNVYPPILQPIKTLAQI